MLRRLRQRARPFRSVCHPRPGAAEPCATLLLRPVAPHVRVMSRDSAIPQSRTARQNLQEGAGGRRHFVFHPTRFDHRTAGRQRGRQDHDDRHDDGATDAHLRQRDGVGRANAASALSRAAADEFRKPLCRYADAAHHSAELDGVRYALRRPPILRERIAELAEALDLTDCSTGRPASSRPARRTRVSLAKSLINSPELLLLDEPTASLDPDTADWVRAQLERYCRDAARHGAACLAQHDRGRAALCERVIIMKRGAHRGRRHAGAAPRPATAAARWRRSSSTWRAGATKPEAAQ